MYEKIKHLIPEGQEKQYEKLIREALFINSKTKASMYERFRQLKIGKRKTIEPDWLGKLAAIFKTDANTINELMEAKK